MRSVTKSCGKLGLMSIDPHAIMPLPPPDVSPFSPNFGQSPLAVVGRNPLKHALGTGLSSGARHPNYLSILMGVRGSGKTVMLNEIEDMAAAAGWVVLSLDAATPGVLERAMNAIAGAEAAYEALDLGGGFTPRAVEKKVGISLGPLAGSVAWATFRDKRVHMGLREHLAFLAQAASAHGTSVLLTLDELHAIDREEGRRLSNDLQHLTKRAEMPLAFVGAGLLEIRHTLMRDRKMTFFHRCEDHEMPPLMIEDAVQGLHQPIVQSGGSITPQALQAAAEATNGSPYALQVIGDQAWRAAGAPSGKIRVVHVEAASVAADAIIDRRVGVPAWHDLAGAHQGVLGALASSGSEVMQSHQVGSRLGIERKQANKLLRELSDLGYVVQTGRGRYGLSGLVAPRVVLREWFDDSSQSGNSDPMRKVAPVGGAAKCRKWMPRAKAYCILGAGHAGGCRSR